MFDLNTSKFNLFSALGCILKSSLHVWSLHVVERLHNDLLSGSITTGFYELALHTYMEEVWSMPAKVFVIPVGRKT